MNSDQFGNILMKIQELNNSVMRFGVWPFQLSLSDKWACGAVMDTNQFPIAYGATPLEAAKNCLQKTKEEKQLTIGECKDILFGYCLRNDINYSWEKIGGRHKVTVFVPRIGLEVKGREGSQIKWAWHDVAIRSKYECEAKTLEEAFNLMVETVQEAESK